METQPRYRTLYLEAQVQAWLAQHYRLNNSSRPESEQSPREALKTLLLHPEAGIWARTRTEENLRTLSKMDLQGLYGLHQMALELALDTYRNPGDTRDKALQDLQQAMDAMIHVAHKTDAAHRLTDAADTLVQACLKVMPALVATKPELWSKYRDEAILLSNRAKAELRTDHPLPLRTADLLTREGQWLLQNGQKEPAQARLQEADQWLDLGIKATTRQDNTLVHALHEAKLKLLAQQQLPRARLEPSIQFLRSSRQEHFQAAAAYYDGLLAEREGKLHYAMQALESATRSNRNDLSRRSLSLLVPIYLNLHSPEKALVALDNLQSHLQQLQSMSNEERQWLFSMIRNPEELAHDRIQALIQLAHQFHQKAKGRPGTNTSTLLKIKDCEADIHNTLTRIKHPWLNGRAKLAFAQYLLQHDRLDELKPLLAELQREHEDWLEVLQLEIGYRLAAASTTSPQVPLPTTLVLEVDNLILQYKKRPQSHPAAKLVWLKWLSSTAREEQARKLLADPSYFGSSDADKRLQALAHLFAGNLQESNELLKALPRDPSLDAVLLQTAHTLADQQALLTSALQHHQDQGIFRTWSASLLLTEGDYAGAARHFTQCLEYSRVRPLVR
ncbi:MAG TPA: hypothetical protein PKA06_12860, partial [Gemmatales bacterium]|nr:hypothetical protein [Gemmatales bacterium]